MYEVPPGAPSPRPRSWLGWAWLLLTSALALAEGGFLLLFGAWIVTAMHITTGVLAAGLVLGFGGGALLAGLALWRFSAVTGGGPGRYRRSGLQACFWLVLVVTSALIWLIAA